MNVHVFQAVRDKPWDLAMVTSLLIHLLVFFYFSSTVSKSIPDYGVRLDIMLQPRMQAISVMESVPAPVIPAPVIPVHKKIGGSIQEQVELVPVEVFVPMDQQQSWIPEPEELAEPVVERAVAAPLLTAMESMVELDDVSQTDFRDEMREVYLASILRIIESARYYPHSARKRGYEDVVKVSFRLMEDGSIKDLLVDGRYSVLRSAAGDAVTQSSPFPRPPESIEVPVLVNYSMIFELS
ncbi:MAG: hypothetical protein GXP22_11445 [Gammaproteobacteria bacterium]|nr:hypothetical protein [Gammaproteobacteria bacterium]